MGSNWIRVEELVAAPHQAELPRVAISQTEIRVVTYAIVQTDDLLKEERSFIHARDDSLGIAITPCLPNFSNF